MSKNPAKKKTLIIGLGPGGGILAAHLVTAGFHVSGIDTWKEHVDAIKKNGITVSRLTSLHIQLPDVGTHIDELKEKDFDYVVIAVKTPHMAEVVDWLKDMPGDFKVIAFQNGLDNEEYLARFFNKDRVLRGAVNYAGNMIEPGKMNMTFFHKPNFVGCICDDNGCECAKEFAQILTEAGLETDAADDIKKFTWRKAILNSPLSPICALLEDTMEACMAFGETRELAIAVVSEAITVAKGLGYDYGDKFLEHCIDYLATAGPHKPSMLIDVENKRGSSQTNDWSLSL